MSEKPVIFISHATTDKPIVDVLKAQIDRVFANGVSVFATSLPEVITSGADWLQAIRGNLEIAQVITVLITPISINRPWIWFEVGASWSKMVDGKGRICPLCVPEVKLQDLPEPLSRLQARSLGKADHVKLFFQELCDEFGFGNMKGFKGSVISTQLPKYVDLKVNQSDLSSGTIYSGPYEAYSDEELEAVLDDYFHQEKVKVEDNKLLVMLREEISRDNVFTGKLVHYSLVDKELNLPPDTSKRLLKKVATERYELIPEQEWEHSIRFRSTFQTSSNYYKKKRKV